MQGANNTYFGDILEGISSLAKGLALTFRHLRDSRKLRKNHSVESADYFNESVGIVTVEYPHEAIPVPDNGRYRLTNEIDDCIVCDLCAKICPVNCIEIEAIKSTEEIGKTSDGSTKRIYAGVFNIDMAKCCYCGLCTTVCPTECLTMTKTYDYSEFDVRNMVYHFSDMTPEKVEEKKKEYEEKQKLKAKPAAPKPAVETEEKKDEVSASAAPVIKKPFKPVIRPAQPKVEEEKVEDKTKEGESAVEAKKAIEGDKKEEAPKPAVKKPVMKPVIKPAVPKVEEENKTNEAEQPEAKNEGSDEKKEEAPKPVMKKPIIKPIMKPKPKPEEGENNSNS